MKDFRDFYFLFVGIFLWAFWIMPFIVIPIILPLSIYKFIVILIAKIFRPDLIPVSRCDSVFTSHRSDQRPVANPAQIWKLKGRLDLQEFREHFQKSFLSSKEDRLKYQNLYCYFEEFMLHVFKKRVEPSELNLKKHIYEIDVEDLEEQERGYGSNYNRNKRSNGKQNGSVLSSSPTEGEEDIIDQFIGRWMAEHTFPMDGPSWEIIIIQPRKGNLKAGSVLLFKIHHGLCDGYSFIHIIEKLTGIKSPYTFKATKIQFWTKVKYLLQMPTIALWLWGRTSLNKDLLYPRKIQNPSWHISFTTLDIDLVKRIRRKTNTHFVNILTSVQTGALRRFFIESGRVSSKHHLPIRMGIAHSLGWPDHPAMTGKGLANNLTLGGFHIPLRDADPLRRLLATEDEYREFDQRGCGELIYWVFFYVTWVNPGFAFRFLLNCNLGFLRHTHVFSSLMCSSQEYSLLGHRVNNLYLPVLTSTTAPNCSMYTVSTSHSGQLDLSINGSSELFKSQKELDVFTQVYFQEEVDNLALACGC